MESKPVLSPDYSPSESDEAERPETGTLYHDYTRRKWVTPGGLPVTHKLYQSMARCDNDEDSDPDPQQAEPAVVWSVTVHNKEFANRKGVSRPFAIYQSDKPLDIPLGTKTMSASTNRAETLNALSKDEQPRLSWTGPVFEFEEPPGTLWYITDDFESLQFEHIYQRRLSILSPFLYRRLKALAGYYPSFFDVGHHTGLEDLTATNAAEIGKPLLLPEPWAFLLHRFPELEAFVQNPEPQDFLDEKEKCIHLLEKEHSRHLVEFLRPQYHALVLPCIRELEQQTPQLPFDMLWYVFAPGTDVYIQLETTVHFCVVYKVTPSHRFLNGCKEKLEIRAWDFGLWYLDSRGDFIRRQHLHQSIQAFDGAKALTSLKICPASIWDALDRGERREKILGQRRLVFESLQKGHLFAQYHGPFGNPVCDPFGGRTNHYSGTVVIDCKQGASRNLTAPQSGHEILDYSTRFEGYDSMVVNTADLVGYDIDPMESGANSRNRTVPGISAPPKAMPREQETRSETLHASPYHGVHQPIKSLTDHQLLLLCPRIWAFALKSKQWLEIGPDGIQELKQSDESIDNLVLEEDEMKTLKGLSSRQNSKRKTWAADFIEGKGTGQVILLHGPPGVGKTYTVEAIAEYLHRPLLALTIADIGTVETEVEQELIKWFTLAEAWNAVLLVDEADIFLERRQNRDLARNGLVSAFLRRMEYFKGLLFLTTNRVGQIDDAFISRVHVAIGYNALSPKDRTKIWEGFFRKLAKERAGKIQISLAAKKWVIEKAMSGEAQLNGRDIRNALQTAITLAEAECEEDPDFDAEKMTIIVERSHFERVLEITNKFQSYVQSIRREDEKKRAAGRYDRNDYWKGEVRGQERARSEF